MVKRAETVYHYIEAYGEKNKKSYYNKVIVKTAPKKKFEKIVRKIAISRV